MPTPGEDEICFCTTSTTSPHLLKKQQRDATAQRNNTKEVRYDQHPMSQCTLAQHAVLTIGSVWRYASNEDEAVRHSVVLFDQDW